MEKQVICVDDSPTFLYAPMYITKGTRYTVRVCPETGTYQVLNPDPEVRRVIKVTGKGDSKVFELTGATQLTRRERVRYLADRFQVISP